jgi:hypothetical protein
MTDCLLPARPKNAIFKRSLRKHKRPLVYQTVRCRVQALLLFDLPAAGVNHLRGHGARSAVLGGSMVGMGCLENAETFVTSELEGEGQSCFESGESAESS